ncbi:MAG TPA: cytochrome P450, partial [Candidatus Binataceae bacterium]
PPGHFLFGNVSELNADPLNFVLKARRDYGEIVRLLFPFMRAYLVAHPDDIKRVVQDNSDNYSKNNIDYRLLKGGLGEGLLTSDGPYWLSQRRLIQPMFNRDRIANFGASMVREAQALIDVWKPRAHGGEAFDVAAEMTRLTLAIVSRTLLSADITRHARVIGESLTTMNEAMAQAGLSALFPALPTRTNRRIRAARRALDAVIWEIIGRRRACADRPDDLLTLLLAARDETGKGLSDTQVRDEVATFLLAGHETTANALAWTWYLLGQNPQVEERLHEELAEVLGGRAPRVEDLARLRYAAMVIDESMRLYPPAWAFSRRNIEDDELGGYRIRRGSLIFISQYLTHRHPAFWEKPDRFDPERFTPERSARRPKYAYFPFSGGPRACIGTQFALTETALILCTIAQHYRLRLVPGHLVEMQPLITLRPRYGVKVVAQPLR